MLKSFVFTVFFLLKAISVFAITPQEFQQLCRSEFLKAKNAFKNLEKGKIQGKDLLASLNDLDIILDKSYNRALLFSNVHPNKVIQKTAADCQVELSKLITEISLSKEVYKQVKRLSESNFDDQDKKYRKDLLDALERSGVNLNREDREKVKTLNDEITKLGQEFSKNIREDVRIIKAKPSDLVGLPEDFIQSHPVGQDGYIRLTTNYPDYFPVIKYAESDELRKKAHVEFKNRAYPQNKNVLKSLLNSRFELARILGYKHYADYITEDKMIGSAANAQNFLDEVFQAAKRKKIKDYNKILAELQKDVPGATKVEDWQKTYYQEKIKNNQFDVDSKQIRKYFPFIKVKSGLFQIVEKLFQISIKKRKVDVWSSEVEAYSIFENEKLIGHFYLDLHPRNNKYKHAAMFPVVSGIKGKNLPEAALICNFPGLNDKSELMEHGQVETFFHEFGHLLHHIFGGHQKYVALSGIATERDFVEAPSQMFEEWAWSFESLALFASDSANKTIPKELVIKMNNAKKFGKSLWVTQQIFYSSISLNFYNRRPDFEPLYMMRDLQKHYSAFDYVDGTHFYANFGHLYGYSAIYYTYMWSLAIADDLFQQFEEKGIFNKETAINYRNKILEPGGSKDANELIKDFLGREFNLGAFKSNL